MSKDADITFSGAELLISSRRSETAGLSGKVAGCLTQRLGHILVNVTFSKRWEIKTISLSLSNVIRVLPQTTRVRFRLMLTFLFVCGSLKTQLLCLFLSLHRSKFVPILKHTHDRFYTVHFVFFPLVL